ncbi:MAG: DUF1015 domain-containing protein [Deltaproteobacteria bacterium]|nr:DUF1015 domain-containing protein [Deltaproteobacteria bacterium]
MADLTSVALCVPELLLPAPHVDLSKWAVVACDQYTSEPEYWHDVARIVGDAPSSLHVIYPEVYLGEPDPDARIARIRATMNDYRDRGLFTKRRGFSLVERSTSTGTRRGLVVALDLERYSFERGSEALIRATEGTILERLPPRIRIRESAPIELPHIMVLIDDPDDTVIGPLAREPLETLYELDLMKHGGHVRGRLVTEARAAAIAEALQTLSSASTRNGARSPFLYAMGDGNHSLATAKTIWERVKACPEPVEGASASPGDPRRFALVELVNVHDPALVFEPIHRVLFDVTLDVQRELEAAFGARLSSRSVPAAELEHEVEASTASHHRLGLISSAGVSLLEIREPPSNLPAGTIQPLLDRWIQEKRVREVDYVHGAKAVVTLGAQPGNVGIFLPSMDKRELFETVVLDGALPRKTFSMGEADDKRFYLEARSLASPPRR